MVVCESFVRSTRKYKYRTYQYIYINGNSPLVCDTASRIAIETIMTIMRIVHTDIFILMVTHLLYVILLHALQLKQ